MKLVVQIPVFNEERTISQVIKSIPRRIPNISKVEILVVDDGSSDNTVKVAKKSGAHHILSLKKHVGLAKTFQASLQKALNLKADIIVNTDGDNQYDQKEIPKLIAPILEGRADMVIGNRQIEKLTHMPRSKKIGNIVGSFLILYSRNYNPGS
ncbi:MAG: Glycosyl transferase family 2 [Berkelbacteria bacterium GW2011_GWA1_36_9]|uniref:Glycosyl transferase family 2 n=1 Tax=Berkelbacteria bacterium GW2011_GWA1_36_9 TaxID=1618331 RepID=A0A0G0FHI1_9BACT|nr:MAG: Glycosyl transferase family 2 [Berkelbacteria bacterium GW2011_GWA1_36_9]